VWVVHLVTRLIFIICNPCTIHVRLLSLLNLDKLRSGWLVVVPLRCNLLLALVEQLDYRVVQAGLLSFYLLSGFLLC
jgi:hypothetical protein